MTIKAYKEILETGKLIQTSDANEKDTPPTRGKIRNISDYFDNTGDMVANRYEQYISKAVIWKVDNLVLNKIIGIMDKIDVYEGQIYKFRLETCGECPKQKIVFEQTFVKDSKQEICSNVINKLCNETLYVYARTNVEHVYYLEYELKK
jgi:hypothetical protein